MKPTCLILLSILTFSPGSLAAVPSWVRLNTHTNWPLIITMTAIGSAIVGAATATLVTHAITAESHSTWTLRRSISAFVALYTFFTPAPTQKTY